MGGVVVDEGPGGVKAPDGGWGWAILSGCFIITGFSYAFPKAVSLGLALNFQPSLIMLNRYFSEKRPLANGLAAAGSPVALCCLSPLGQVLYYTSNV
ncbi:unnamed protein product [Coregonus sp. 'balchen']|nr:unnamed protein product [Coregonus sp. 'balchen']